MGLLTRKLATVELANGDIFTDVRIIQADVRRYELTAQKHHWPAVVVKDGSGTVPHQDDSDRFQIWAALKREGKYDDTWETFADRDLVDFVIDEEPVDPTRSAPDTD
jgi:hypothetical protein